MLGAVDKVLPPGAARRLGDQLVLQLVEMLDALAGFVARLAIGLGDVEGPGDKRPAPPPVSGALPAVLIARALRADIGPGRVPGAGKNRIAEPADCRKRVGRACGDA